MASVQEHYGSTLAPVYSWIFGGLEQLVERNTAFFERHNIKPRLSCRAIDLGAGSGAQSIPLARRGFDVAAIDFNAALLNELRANAGKLSITTTVDDILNLPNHCTSPVELVVCMTDTVLHLGTSKDVRHLFELVYQQLEKGGKFIVTVRDLTYALPEEDRFIPLRKDSNTIASCFLDYEQDTVKVYDLIYQRHEDTWKLNKSFYRKLRLSFAWLKKQLADVGFTIEFSDNDNGLITVIAEKY